MPFPGFREKHDEESYVTPQDWYDWRRQRGDVEGFACPEAVVMLYQPTLFASLSQADDAQPAGGRVMPGLFVLGRTKNRVGVLGGFGYGAPIAVQMLENLIAVGARGFISLGAAGGLQPDLAIGDVVVCTAAVRDEGVSYHYLPSEAPVAPDPQLTAALRNALEAAGPIRSGATWTIDAPYRETVAEVAHYQAEGVMTVEMEASALFAVASVRGVPLASVFCISDLLTDLAWDPRFDAPELHEGLAALTNIAIDVLAGECLPR